MHTTTPWARRLAASYAGLRRANPAVWRFHWTIFGEIELDPHVTGSCVITLDEHGPARCATCWVSGWDERHHRRRRSHQSRIRRRRQWWVMHHQRTAIFTTVTPVRTYPRRNVRLNPGRAATVPVPAATKSLCGSAELAFPPTVPRPQRHRATRGPTERRTLPAP